MAPPPRPLTLRLLAFGQRALHRVSDGRFGSVDGGAEAPRGKALAGITAVHRRLYRWTGGIVGGNAGGLATLLLTTTGRRTGLARTVPLPYFEVPEGIAVVASFAGGPRNPAWYENLVANPDVDVQIQRRRFRAVATAVPQAERPAVWSQIVLRAPMYADYQKATEREIPVVILEPRA